MDPEAIYTKDQTPLYIIRVVLVLLLLFMIYVIWVGWYVFAGFLLFLVAAFSRFSYTTGQNQVEVKVYSEYITVSDVNSELLTIYYSNIIKAGFLQSAQYVSRMDRSEKYRAEQLILLRRNNGKFELPQDLQNAHELCAIIQSRIS